MVNRPAPDEEDLTTNEEFEMEEDTHDLKYANASLIRRGIADFRISFFNLSPEDTFQITSTEDISKFVPEVEIIFPYHFLPDLIEMLVEQGEAMSKNGLLDFHLENMARLKNLTTDKIYKKGRTPSKSKKKGKIPEKQG